jgi:hypothetical protein
MLPILASAIASLFLTSSPGLPAQTTPFVELTNHRSEFTNFNIETVRGMCTAQGWLGFYALNTHGSMLVWHQDLTPAPEGNWHTVNGPVALAPWNNTILVVGGATHALVQHDRFNGRILNSVRLPAEPADIVVDSNSTSPTKDSAFIACQGANAVVRVNLNTFTVVDTYPIASQRPRFLYLEHAGNLARVYVAPFLSGNNTVPVPPGHPLNPNGSRAIILDVSGATISLPDEDLYRISIDANGAAQVQPVLKSAGTLLTRHGRNPDGKYWMLSVDSLNALPNSTEPSIRGAFAESQLAIATALGPGLTPTVIDLDLFGGSRSAATAMSFPSALAFRSSGYAVVASSTSDRLTLLDSAGVRIRDVWLPAGSIPRDLMFDSSGNILFVYAWGTNRVLVYDFNALPLPPSTTVPFTLDLGHDPTPAPIGAGRTIWYDADRSLNSRTTCNTCHPGGKLDGLGWAISDDPSDRKDVMVTQSLLSIVDTPSYHWRGERDLRQFNKAFVRLLGGASALSTAEFDQLESFLFSLQAPANPRESDARVVDDARAVVVTADGYTSRATAGQAEFRTVPALFGNTCVSCHNGQTGSDGSLTMDTILLTIPSAMTLEVAHLRELFHKDQEPFDVKVAGNTLTVARTGFGLLHDGVEPNVFEFVEPPESGGPFTIDKKQQANITSFVGQFDAGLAPAAHISQLIDPAHNSSSQQGVVTNLLVPQATNRWIDLVALSRLNGADVRWYFDAGAAPAVFRANVAGLTPLTPAALLGQAAQGQNMCLFLGVPPGNGRRFALDPDFDQLTDDREANLGANRYVADTDGDQWSDGYEADNGGNPTNALVQPADSTPPTIVSAVLDHAGATYAKYFVEFSEPCVYQVDASASGVVGAPVHSMRSAVWQKTATIVVQQLESSTPPLYSFSTPPNVYVPSLLFADQAGMTGTATLPAATMDTHAHTFSGMPYPEALVRSIAFNGPISGGGGILSGQVEVRIRNKAAYPAPSPFTPSGYVVVQVLVEKVPVVVDPLKKDWIVSDTPAYPLTSINKATTLTMRIGATTAPYTPITGALLVGPVNSSGSVILPFSQGGLTSGQGLRFNVVAVLDPITPIPPPPALPTFDGLSVLRYQVAATPEGQRALDTTY